ncbi:hypothetical protein B7463_g8997, partial [Scytalidium lignicola]
MSRFQIGSIDKRWVNFEPPISGGTFRPYQVTSQKSAACGVKSGLCHSEYSTFAPKDDTTKTKVATCSCNDFGTKSPSLINAQKMESNPTDIGTFNKCPKQFMPAEYIDYAERLEIDSDLSHFPSMNPETQSNIALKYRKLHRKVEEHGYYNCHYSEYAIECFRYLSLFTLSMVALRYEWYITSAVFLGLFWHQIMFSAHDAGHMAITHNFVIDTLIGIFVADFCCGLSIGWWKSSHNVHHLVPNHPIHDPDIQNVPLFATSPTFFRSIRSSYYDFCFTWNKGAEIAVGFQKYTYYPIMCVARFNLYLLSLQFLVSDKSRTLGSAYWTRPTELLCMVCYWYMFVYLLLLKSIPTWTLRVAFVLVSHIVTMPLHVQITLSHFGMSTADLGASESFAQKQLRTTMDIDCPTWLDFIHGGLQFQAVHHLFPRVPRHNLRKVQRLVKEFCKEVGIEYTIYGFVDGNKVVLSRLGEISKQVKILAACQKHMVETGESGLN